MPLRFGKSSDYTVEKRYSSHYVNPKHIAELKAQKEGAP